MQGRVPGQWFPPPFTAPMDMKWMAPGVPVALSYNLKASFGYIGAEHMGVFGSELAVEAHKIIFWFSHRHKWFSRIQLCCQLFSCTVIGTDGERIVEGVFLNTSNATFS